MHVGKPAVSAERLGREASVSKVEQGYLAAVRGTNVVMRE